LPLWNRGFEDALAREDLPAGHDAVDRLAAINSGPKTLARLETAWNEEYFRSIVAV
jgi:hypothetical protein